MKSNQICLFVFFISMGYTILSCQKELTCELCEEANLPPIAVAGQDQVVTLPVDSILVDGSASSDPDGTIKSFFWKKIGGPASFTISHPNNKSTTIKDLAAGVYLLELKVTDEKDLFTRDTMQITVNDTLVSIIPNHPPVANAGPDQTITLPVNSVTIDGGGSTDPDNNITGYTWKKISGPSTYTIANAEMDKTQVSTLGPGVYHFELKVSDATGLFSKDTLQIFVNAQQQLLTECDNKSRAKINAQLIPIAVLPMPRGGMAIASAGNKLLFAGGGCSCAHDTITSRVDIYDIGTQLWSTNQLSEARSLISAVTAGSKVFFAGGEIGDGTTPVSTVDIYDVAKEQWSTSQLSAAGNSITAATVSDKVLFFGGDGGHTGGDRRRVDIYNLTTNSWSIFQLSTTKHNPTAVSVNNKIFFAGGGSWNREYVYSDRIDIYDNATNTWSVSTLKEPRAGHAGISVAGKIYWAGGATTYGPNPQPFTCSVEIRDLNTGITTIKNLARQSAGPAILKDNKIIFFTATKNDNRFDIYNIETDTWSIGVLPLNYYGGSIFSVNNTVYLAGGSVDGILSDKLWKLEF